MRLNIRKINLRKFFLHIILPTVLTLLLFIVLIFAYIIPYFQKNLLNGKKEVISELVSAAHSLAEKYHQESIKGILSEEEAKKLAILHIRRLHYGVENKDYFWLTDMHPRMIMHPYRPDLDGKDLSGFVDAKGKKLFVEMVQTARKNGEGYVDYMWQWMDDSTRIVPKISFVKAYKPWNWVIGTGIYIEDVRDEISTITRKLVYVSLGITLLMILLLTYIVKNNLTVELIRARAENDLKESKERYKALVEASNEGTWMIMDGQRVYENKKMQEITRQSSYGHISEDLHEILHPDEKDNLEKISSFIQSGISSFQLETAFLSQSGEKIPVLIAVSRITLSNRNGFILTARDLSSEILKEALTPRDMTLIRDELIEELSASSLLVNLPVSEFITPVVHCQSHLPVKEAVSLMVQHNTDTILVEDVSGNMIGILTTHDLKERILEPGLPTHTPVASVMTAPLITVGSATNLDDALMIMHRKNISQVIVTGQDGQAIGMIQQHSLIRAVAGNASFLRKSIQASHRVDELRSIREKLPGYALYLSRSGIRTSPLTRLITSASEDITEKLIRLVLHEMGTPPVPFAFITMGSEGRQEQTFVTDQDNAIIYADTPEEQKERVSRYFLLFGERICHLLHEVGYKLCKGGIMASNPKWNAPISVWKNYFSAWISHAEPQHLLEISIFFDYRGVYGDESLVSTLQHHIHQQLQGNPSFFIHLARNCLYYKPPVGLFGRIHTQSSAISENSINLKHATAVLVNIIRLYALRHQIYHTNTLNRLDALFEKKVFPEKLYRDFYFCYDFLMMLRFRVQTEAYADSREMNNFLDISSTPAVEMDTLKSAFTQITSFQSKLKYDFNVPG